MDSVTFRTCIKPSLKRRLLLRGTFLAGCGSFLMLVVGGFSSMAFIEMWGWLAFFLGFGLIALGLVPYRRLCRLESFPHKIVVDQGGTLNFFEKNQLLVKLPLSAIETVSYDETKWGYGISIDLKKQLSEQIVIPSFPYRRKKKDRIFFPYFNLTTCSYLQELLKEPS